MKHDPTLHKIEAFKLIGIALEKKTTNANGQSGIDCGYLWQKFEKEGYFNQIDNKLSNEIFAVYHDYEGDHTQPYAYFIGCKVPGDAKAPEGMAELTIASGDYKQIIAQGVMPDCVGNAWRAIWQDDMPRAYQTDFEIYDERSSDWSNATVEIYVGVK